MAYTIYITRQPGTGAAAAGPATIGREEWQQYVAGDPAMRLYDYARDPGYADGDLGYRQYLEGLAAWLGDAPDAQGYEHAWFSYQSGQVLAEDPDAATVQKAQAIARALSARVRDDAGYLAAAGPARLPAPAPPAEAPAPPVEAPAEVAAGVALPGEAAPGEDPSAGTGEAAGFRDFQTYGSAAAAQPLLAALGQAGITCRTTHDTGRLAFDPSFANNQLTSKYVVQVPLAGFAPATAVLADLNQRTLASLDAGHYLFGFSDEELMELLVKPDEWSALDVALAGELLRQRGHDVSPDTLRLLRQRRTAELAQPESEHRAWVLGGYLTAMLGGFLGILIGYQLYSSRKQLPDGRRLHTYSARDRVHGLRIMALGSVMFVLLLLLRLLRPTD